ncbi:MAG: transcription elongation factor GreA [Bacilli bacterium]|nr:transcription elongation factor GreA [Bacilli bacterium]
MAEKKLILTEAEREQLNKEYRHLIDVERDEVIDQLTLARSQGDLSENADYDAARDRQSKIEARITEIENILNNAISADELIESGKGSASKINIGDTVTFVDVETGLEAAVMLVGGVGANPENVPPTVSIDSPIGKALLEKKVGATVLVECNEPYTVKITNIKKA